MKRKEQAGPSAGETGRLEKKIRDQARELKRLREKLERTYEGSVQLRIAVNALLTAAALAHGEKVIDPERPEKRPGRRLEIPRFSAEEMGRRYVLSARRGDGGYVIEVWEKDDLSVKQGML